MGAVFNSQTQYRSTICMQYYISKDMYAVKCMDRQVCNDCTYRMNSVSEGLSEDVRIYFRFNKVSNTL